MKKFLGWLIVILIVLPEHAWSQGAQPAGKLTLLTYNVLADPVHYQKRIPALLDILEKSDADIIALQEVDTWFANVLFDQKWVNKYHILRDRHGKILLADEYIILSKHPISAHYHENLPGKYRRTLFAVKTVINGKDVIIGTCHLESPLNAGEVRARQLERFFTHLNATDESIFLGDFNFGDGEQPETESLDPQFEDVWLTLRPHDPGYTWNREISDMADQGSFPNEPSRRIDRILVKSAGWKPTAVMILGNEAVSADTPNVFPSDHFGLLATLEWQDE